MNLSGALQYTATRYQVAPVAAKAAIDTMTRNLATELGKSGIRCYCVAPWCDSGNALCSEVVRVKVGGNVVVPRAFVAAWAEVASAALFQCLNEYVAGHITVVDGGAWFQTQPFLPRDLVARRGKRLLGDGPRSTGDEQQTLKSTRSDKLSLTFFAAAWSPQRRERAVVCSCHGAQLPASVSFGAADTEEMDELKCSLRS